MEIVIMSKKYDIYIASPLFCEEDNAELDVLEHLLEVELGLKVFTPRRDSEADFRSAKTLEEKESVANYVVNLNEEAIRNSAIVIANTKGVYHNNALYGDSGTIWEVGMAQALNIPVITLNFHGYGSNIMLAQSSLYHCDKLSITDTSQLSKIVEALFANDVFQLVCNDMINPASLKQVLKNLRLEYYNFDVDRKLS